MRCSVKCFPLQVEPMQPAYQKPSEPEYLINWIKLIIKILTVKKVNGLPPESIWKAALLSFSQRYLGRMP